MAAGYSKKPLAEKLGIKQGTRIIVLKAPPDYFHTLGLPEGVCPSSELNGPSHFIHFFTKSLKDLEALFPVLKRKLFKDGVLWISWPKGSCKVETDLNENLVRRVGLKNGLVDVKVCAVDEIWSGLKFVYRKIDRK